MSIRSLMNSGTEYWGDEEQDQTRGERAVSFEDQRRTFADDTWDLVLALLPAEAGLEEGGHSRDHRSPCS